MRCYFFLSSASAGSSSLGGEQTQPWPVRRRLREQHVVVTAHAVDERHRHPASRIAEFRMLVIFRKRQQRQHFLHIAPPVGIELLLLRENAGVLEVAEADVEGGERQPRPVGLVDARRQLGLEIAQVARGGDDALRGIEQVAQPEMPGGVLGDLHDAAHAGGAGRGRVPLRFLVGDGGEEPPLDAALFLRVVEERPVLRKHGAHSLLQHFGVDALDLLRIRHVAIGEAGERPVAPELQDEPVEVAAQVGEAGRHRPGDVPLRARRKGDIEIEVDVAGERGRERAHDRVADRAVRNLRDESPPPTAGRAIPLDARMGNACGGNLVFESRIRHERDGGAVEITPIRGFEAVPVVDHHGFG